MSPADQPLLTVLRDIAVNAARAGGAAALRHFGNTGLQVDHKADESPVTRADREAEAAIRAVISAERPADGWLGEETGEHAGSSPYLWIVDPVDGTKNFIAGRPTWTTLVACEDRSHPAGPRVVAAAVFQPASGRLAEAVLGGGARLDGQRLRVSGEHDPHRARWAHYTAEWFATNGWASLHQRLAARACLVADRCDADGHLLVAAGQAEAVFEPKLAVWDIAATSLIVAEAGGRFSTRSGTQDIRAGHAVLTNGRVHEAVLAELADMQTRRV